MFAALLAPAIFSTIAEYPITIVLALLLRPGSRRPRPGTGFLRRNADVLLPFALLAGVLVAAKATPADGAGPALLAVLLFSAVAALALFAARPVRFALGVGALLLIATLPPTSLHSERTFFGVLRVEEEGQRHVLVSGTTVHGAQSFAPGQRREPASYYIREGPLGQLFTPWTDAPRASRSSGSAPAEHPSTGAPASAGRSTRSTRRSPASPRTRATSRTCATRRPTSASSSATAG